MTRPPALPTDRHLTRRSVLATSAWAGPVITISAASPAFAASDELTLTATSPARGTFSAAISGSRTVSVALLRGTTPEAGESVTFTLSDSSWLTLDVSADVTDAAGLAAATLQGVPSATPPSGATVVLTAAHGGLTLTWHISLRQPLLAGTSAGQGDVMTVVDGRPQALRSTSSGDIPADVAITSLGPELMIGDDGNVYAFGSNNQGRLGLGPDVTRATVPTLVVAVPGGRAVAGDSGAEFSVVAGEFGDIYTAGANNYGQLGDGTTTARTVWGPALRGEIPPSESIRSLAAGHSHTLALSSAGQVYAWGLGEAGQLGTASQSSHEPALMPAGEIPAGVRVVQVSSTIAGSLLLADDGNLYVCGHNPYGALSHSGGGYFLRSGPVPAARGAIPPEVAIVSVAGGWGHSLALDAEGRVYGAGYNEYGAVGDGTATHRSSFVRVTGGSVSAATRFLAVGTAGHESLAVDTSGAVHIWGTNSSQAPRIITLNALS